MQPFQALKHCHKDGEGLTAGQIHRLWQQVFVDRYCYVAHGKDNSDHSEPPPFTGAQLRWLAGAVEHFGMICYDAGFYRGEKKCATNEKS